MKSVQFQFAGALFAELTIGISGCVLIWALHIPWTMMLAVRNPAFTFGWGTIAAVLEFLIMVGVLYALPEKVRNWEWGNENKRFQAFHNRLNTAQEIVLMAVTAVGEELFFRGAIQSLAFELWSSPGLAIGAATLIFALFHSRFVRKPVLLSSGIIGGILLGWLFWWTGNIWASVWAHFLFNMALVVVAKIATRRWSAPGSGEAPLGESVSPTDREMDVFDSGRFKWRGQGLRILVAFLLGFAVTLVAGLVLVR
ncbi:MAG: CPBP family intramembrane metalloprotease [Kyrpidia tusciae]|nr:CPBP family intramembrane glutamic endopeptidase [Kyrpidia tusciae]MBE3552557.1 CPBP family intramembrane metalloprotease [Kyrpidia tusciae]